MRRSLQSVVGLQLIQASGWRGIRVLILPLQHLNHLRGSRIDSTVRDCTEEA